MMWGVRGMKLLTFFFFDRSREAVCEIGSEMDIRTRDTVNSRLTDTLLLRAPREYEQQLNPSDFCLLTRTLTRGPEGDLNNKS